MDRGEQWRAGWGWCGHERYPVEVRHAEGGHIARCLGCGCSGPPRPSSTGALTALRNEALRPVVPTR